MINRFLGIGERETIGSALARHRGIGPGFDLLRIGLALYIFYGHALWIAGGASSVAGVPTVAAAATAATAVVEHGFTGWTRPFHVAAVPVFFALSGFLVIGSALRLRATSTFLAFRFMRIFPALIVETCLCAVLLGAALTTLPLDQYFREPGFWRYLGNMVGWISFHLPGVFKTNPVQNVVNANLWTLPSEFDCYAITAVLMITRIIYSRRLFTLLYAVVGLSFLVASFAIDFSITPGILPPVAITFYFFTGVLIYHWRDQIPANGYLFIAAAILSYLLLLEPRAVYIAPIPVAYCMAFFGMIAIPKIPLIGRGDYSYGIYLYGFPICQGLVAAFPDVFVGHRYLMLAAGGIATCIWAAFSWHMIEIHALKLKRHLPPRWFPKPVRPVPRQSPEGRAEQAGVTA